MAADFVTRWADFDGGDWGNKDPGRAKANEFFGENVVVYNSGLLGVRHGLAELTITGLPNHADEYSPHGLEIWNDQLILVSGQVWRIPIPADKSTSVAAVQMGTLPDGPVNDEAVFAQYAGRLFLNRGNGKIYEWTDPTWTTISTPFLVVGLTRWNYYLVAWDAATPYRLWYTDVDEAGAHPETWGDNNFLDVGGNEPITALIPMYNYLYVAKKSGWYAVSGVLRDRPYVRRVTTGNGPLGDREVTMTTDNRILYWGQAITPVWFNGDTAYLDDDFRVRNFRVSYGAPSVAASITQRRNVMLGEPADDFASVEARTQMLVYDSNRWTTHALDVPLGGIFGHDPRVTIGKPADVMFMCNRGDGDPVKIYSLNLNMERPANEADEWSDPHDQSADHLDMVEGYVELPAFYDSQSRMCLVRSVVVQLQHFPSGTDGDLNEIQCELRPLGKFEGGSLTSDPQVWMQPAELANPRGSDETWRIGFGDIGWANGFQVVFPRMKGVAIRSVEAHVEVRTARL